MTSRQQSYLIYAGLVLFVVALVYLAGRQPRETPAQACARACHPKVGVLERDGPTLGPDWRPSPRNLICVCR